MNKKSCGRVSFLAVVLGASSALAAPPNVAVEAPAEAIAAGPPTWCAGVTAKDPSQTPTLSSDVHGGLKLDGLREIVLYSCEKPNDPERQAWTRAVRQSISNDYGLTRADNEQLLKIVAQLNAGNTRYETPEPKNNPGCKQLAPSSSGTHAQRLTRTLERIGIGCGDWRNQENRETTPPQFGREATPYWLVDHARGFGSELAEAVFVNDVLADFRDLGKSAATDLRYYLRWVNASGVTLDDATFRKQLAAMKLPAPSHAQAILTFRRAVARFERQKKYLESVAKKDSRLEALFFSGPSAARAQWTKAATEHAKTFEAILALEAKLPERPGGMPGCAEALFPTFQTWVKAAVAANPKVTPQELETSDFLGANLVYGLALCARNDDKAPVLDQVIGFYENRTEPQRGPIAASHIGMLTAFNKADGKLELSEPGRPVVTPPSLGESLHASYFPMDPNRARSGIVASVKTTGATTTITFGKQARKEPTLECGYTTKLWRVTPNGTRIFEYTCKKTGERSVTAAPAPITVPTYAAGGIKAGGYLSYWQYPNGEVETAGWPLEGFADTARKKRVNFLGVKL